MNETKMLNEWMDALGYRWVPGKEQIIKAQLTKAQAVMMLQDLLEKGAVIHV